MFATSKHLQQRGRPGGRAEGGRGGRGGCHFPASLCLIEVFNKTEQASVMWVLTTPLPTDADKNYAYANREPWWGDSSAWINVDIASDPSDPSSVLVRSLPSCLSNLFPPPSPLRMHLCLHVLLI